jgi:hypothetical protein
MTDHKYGPKHEIVANFIAHILTLNDEDWIGVRAQYKSNPEATWGAAQNAAWATREPTNSNKFAVSFDASNDARAAVKFKTAQTAPCNPAWDTALGAVGSAISEIQGADLMRERGQPFFFLPMFGFADEHAVIAALQPKDGNP